MRVKAVLFGEVFPVSYALVVLSQRMRYLSPALRRDNPSVCGGIRVYAIALEYVIDRLWAITDELSDLMPGLIGLIQSQNLVDVAFR